MFLCIFFHYRKVLWKNCCQSDHIWPSYLLMCKISFLFCEVPLEITIFLNHRDASHHQLLVTIHYFYHLLQTLHFTTVRGIFSSRQVLIHSLLVKNIPLINSLNILDEFALEFTLSEANKYFIIICRIFEQKQRQHRYASIVTIS